eukprot:1389987-Amorphochlora_amoeboformis.AAC.1
MERGVSYVAHDDDYTGKLADLCDARHTRQSCLQTSMLSSKGVTSSTKRAHVSTRLTQTPNMASSRASTTYTYTLCKGTTFRFSRLGA